MIEVASGEQLRAAMLENKVWAWFHSYQTKCTSHSTLSVAVPSSMSEQYCFSM
jgi:hypothetical protein